MERVGDAPVLEAAAQAIGRSALHPTILVEARPTLATPQRHFEGGIADRLRLLSVQHTRSQRAVRIEFNRLPSRTSNSGGVQRHVEVELAMACRKSPP